MCELKVTTELLEALLKASINTVKKHRGTADEIFALGSLESLCNLVNIIGYESEDSSAKDLIIFAQESACDAVERAEELGVFKK